MTYVPFEIRLYAAIDTAIRDGFNAELTAIGQPTVPDTAFEPCHPLLVRGETVAILRDHAERETQAKYWVETSHHYEVQLFAFGVNAADLQRRLIYFEYAAIQVLDKNRTMGGLLTTLSVGSGSPPPMLAHRDGSMCDGMILPVACQPAVRVAVPEHS
jgi:hypothetical protein